MAYEQAIWRIDGKLAKLTPFPLAREIDLETYIDADISILNPGWLVIGRQVYSDIGPLDLLAIDRSAGLIVIELKRHLTTREMTAQAIDYAAWVEGLRSDEIASIYKKYCDRWHPQESHVTLNEAFRNRFGIEIPEEDLNSSHQIVLVASELDNRTERVVRYLANRNVKMDILFFQVFADGDRKFLSRVWLLNDGETEEQVSKNRAESLSQWNGEYYASFGLGERRDWEDARKYGYISAGGGRWYSSTLQLLEPGGRVWVKIPGQGYVGVGEVIGRSQKASEFQVTKEDGSQVSVLDVIRNGPTLKNTADDPDLSEYFVPVRWLKTLPANQALKEVGFFGLQHSACKPRTPKWLHTVDRLKQLFDLN